MSVFFDTLATVYRFSTYAKGNGGEKIETWTTHIDVYGSFQKNSGEKSIINNQQVFKKGKIFYCEVVDIADNDRLVISDKIYNILDVYNVFSHHLEIDLDIRST